MDDYLKGLNERQLDSVLSGAQRKVVVAGAGTGKTYTLVRMIKKDSEMVPFKNMVAITFTRYAANELMDRLKGLVGDTDIFTGTIHAFCLTILEEHAEQIGRTPDFSLYDQDDRKDIIESIIEKFNFKMAFSKLPELLKKNDSKAKLVIDEYEQRMQIYNAIDLDQIVTKTVELLNNHPSVLAKYRSRIGCMYVDEFQDTNYSQLEIIKLINPKMLRIIGDPDQSIYEWNNANPEILNEIHTHFEGVEIFKLVDNYRSTNQIIAKSNQLIRHNVNRIDKDLIAHKDGEEVDVWLKNDLNDEICEIEKCIKTPYSSNAIICRTNAKAKAIFEYLVTKYPTMLMANSQSIYKKPHIKHFHSLLHAVMNPNDKMSLLRFMVAIGLMPRSDADSVFNSLLTESTTSDKKTIVDAFTWLKSVYTINSLSKTFDIYTVYGKVIEEFDIISVYKDADRKSKINDFEQLRKSINRWKLKQEYYGLSTSLKAYLRYVMLIDIQESQTESEDAIRIMTVHGSKGLEFENVFVPSVNRDEFPSKQSDNEEEERRLMYVAMTRAKEKLYVSSTLERTLFNGFIQLTGPSKFIQEIQ